MSKEDYNATRQKMVEVNRIMVGKDKRRIEGYLERNKLEMFESPTGLWYSVQNPAQADSVKPGMLVKLSYRLSLLDGTTCYHSQKDGIKSFRVGHGGVESGLEEGMLLMKVGGRAKFIMPPHLAYGLTGDGDCIPARAIIIYDIEVLSAE
jgi:FKBP-type peptidyl-prolyl cis-trans isomerase FkpA